MLRIQLNLNQNCNRIHDSHSMQLMKMKFIFLLCALSENYRIEMLNFSDKVDRFKTIIHLKCL